VKSPVSHLGSDNSINGERIWLKDVLQGLYEAETVTGQGCPDTLTPCSVGKGNFFFSPALLNLQGSPGQSFFSLLTFFCKQCLEKDSVISIVDITNNYKKCRYELFLIMSLPSRVVTTI
jgi:hypothetical protein